MNNAKHIRHYHRHMGFSYAHSIEQRVYSIFIAPIVFVMVSIFILQVFSRFSVPVTQELHLSFFLHALIATFMRLLVAYLLAVVVAIPLALLINYSPKTERVLFPLFDITQSIPVLAFFPVIIVLFTKSHFLNGAAVFILFLSMLWNIVFSLIAGLKVVPGDIISAARIFGLSGLPYLRKVLLPSVFPYIVTGSLLAWAQGWNVIMVAEVLHTYIPGASSSSDLFGVGSIMVNAIASGRNDLFLAALLVMVLAIAFLNFFVWQRLLRYGEKFKFD